MGKYVDREKLIMVLTDMKHRLELNDSRLGIEKKLAIIIWDTLGTVMDIVKNFPAADVIERKKGMWIQISPAKIYECSQCGKSIMTGDIFTYKFCFACGAEMKKEEEECVRGTAYTGRDT